MASLPLSLTSAARQLCEILRLSSMGGGCLGLKVTPALPERASAQSGGATAGAIQRDMWVGAFWLHSAPSLV